MSYPATESPPTSQSFRKVSECILTTLDAVAFITEDSAEIDFCSKSLNNVLGYPSEMLTLEGWPFLLSVVHPLDRQLPGYKLLTSISKGVFFENEDCCLTIRFRHGNGRYLLIAIDVRRIKEIDKNNSLLICMRNVSPYGDWEKPVLKTKRVILKPLHHEFRHQVFTRSERKIAHMVVTGLTNKQIAYNLRLSPNTVRTHRTNLMRKSGCTNGAQLAVYLTKNP